MIAREALATAAGLISSEGFPDERDRLRPLGEQAAEVPRRAIDQDAYVAAANTLAAKIVKKYTSLDTQLERLGNWHLDAAERNYCIRVGEPYFAEQRRLKELIAQEQSRLQQEQAAARRRQEEIARLQQSLKNVRGR
jgi:hypothetical protein